MESKRPAGFQTGGVIILAQQTGDSDKCMALYPQNELPQPFSNLSEGCSGEVSPDGRWLAEEEADNLLILSSDGKIRASYPWNEKWNRGQGWLDNERLVFNLFERTKVAIGVLNPFKGEEITLEPALDDIFTLGIEKSGWPVWKSVYDPTLTRLTYMRDHGGDNTPGLVMVDLSSGKTLWEIRRNLADGNLMPAWSPDGIRMVAAVDDNDPIDDIPRLEIFTVDRNGLATQWIDMKIKPHILEEPKWSPNGRYLAFYGEYLYVLDTETRQVFYLCLPFVTQGEEYIYPFHIITWSPDSRQIIFQRRNAPAILIDLDSNRAVPLADDLNTRPVGWMQTEQ